MKVLYVLSLLLVASLVAAAHGCVCTADYTPVCGVDGKTYSNACRLGCAGVKMARTGPCDGSSNS